MRKSIVVLYTMVKHASRACRLKSHKQEVVQVHACKERLILLAQHLLNPTYVTSFFINRTDFVRTVQSLFFFCTLLF